MKEESPKAIFYALAANLGIAIFKYAAAAFTGSGSMFAEAIHSSADCGNQLLLLFVLREARKTVSALHPMGSGREINFYSLLVALLLFFVGGAFSVYEGVHRLIAREPLQFAFVALAVLGVSVVLESLSLWGALKEIRKTHPDQSLWRWFRETRESDLLVVAGEDIAALFGLAIAFVAVLLTMLTGNPVYDALGSVGVGFLLMTIAWLVAREVKSMLVGESASTGSAARDRSASARASRDSRHHQYDHAAMGTSRRRRGAGGNDRLCERPCDGGCDQRHRSRFAGGVSASALGVFRAGRAAWLIAGHTAAKGGIKRDWPRSIPPFVISCRRAALIRSRRPHAAHTVLRGDGSRLRSVSATAPQRHRRGDAAWSRRRSAR